LTPVPVEVRPEEALLKVDSTKGAGGLGAVVVLKYKMQLEFESLRAGSGRA